MASRGKRAPDERKTAGFIEEIIRHCEIKAPKPSLRGAVRNGSCEARMKSAIGAFRMTNARSESEGLSDVAIHSSSEMLHGLTRRSCGPPRNDELRFIRNEE